MTARSYLFVPADRPDRFPKALAAGADKVIIDLEDAIAATAKEQVRAPLAAWLQQTATPVTLRINGADTDWFEGDLALCALPGVDGVMLPKTEGSRELAVAAQAAPGRRLLPMIETAVGLHRLEQIAGAPGVERLAFGSLDLQLDLGIDGEGEELLLFRSQIVLASRLAQLQAPVDGVCTAIEDAAQVEHDAARARRLGFGAKLCIHPRQVGIVNRVFTPSAAEVERARRVVEAAERSRGAAVKVDGRMVDLPVIRRAQDVLRQAGQATGPG
jgi:citrate lyase subunit beta/citryl-CoA lyase